ncbi:prephenate dehydrogenase [Bordetella tumulicola]|uniref:prephenate dehydrogenase n=1 Tax=Bordetella tumulicola TaxID=1649133 RepID=UPI0039EF4E2C
MTLTAASGVAQGADGPLIPVLAVVGVGLIGGSVALALREAGQVGRVLGVGRNAQSLTRAQALGLIDEVATPEQAAAEADVVLLAMPVGGVRAALTQMRPHLRPETLLTDAGSTKLEIVEAARAVLGDRIGQFVPGHPIAGAERSGPEAASATLYRHRTVILTPLPENTSGGVARVRELWQACGARVFEMEAQAHDRVLGSISHMPHLLAAAYMAQVAGADDAALRLTLAGTGFRDFTRIAAGSPEMWRDIFLSNRDALRVELGSVRAVLDEMERAMVQGDGEALEALLLRAAQARRNWRKE